MSQSEFRIAVLISGGGTTLRNLFDRIDAGELNVRVGLVISSSATAKGLQYATERNVPVVVAPKKDQTGEEYCEQIFRPIRQAEIDLVVMGGFLKHVLIPDDFENRVINIHPSLIPSFSGQGFYGHRVHQAVLDQGCKVSGCTVHFVDNQFDHGPIIAQRAVNVLPGDTADRLQKRVFESECQIYPKVIEAISQNQVSVKNGKTVSPESLT